MLLLNPRIILQHVARRYNSRCAIRLLINDEETCFIAHHSEQGFDYKYTRPLPERTSSTSQVTPLKVNSRHMFTDAPNLEQLQALTYTHASYWNIYPGKAKRMRYKAAFDDKVDRKGVQS